MDLRLVQTTEPFAVLASQWDSLVDSVAGGNVFLTHSWLLNWWKQFGDSRKLCVIIGEVNHLPVALLPLMIEPGPGATRRLVYLGSGLAAPNHLDLIVQPEHRLEFEQAAAKEMMRIAGQWDVFEINSFPGDTAKRESFVRALTTAGFAPSERLFSDCYFATLPDTFEGYLATLGTEYRQQIKRRRRQLTRDAATVEFACVKTAEELQEAFDATVRLHQALWTGRGESGIFADSAFTDFLRETSAALLSQDRLRLYYIKVNGQIIAVNYACRSGTSLYGYNGGFDTAWSKYSVGVQLYAHAIEQSIAEGIREVDFLQGDESYKKHWATGVRQDWCIRAPSPRLRGRLMCFGADTVDAMRDWWRKRSPSKPVEK